MSAMELPDPGSQDAPNGGSEEIAQPIGRGERLGLLLFVLREKLDQRLRLYHKAMWALFLLAVVALAAMIFCPYYIWVVEKGKGTFWTWAYFGALAAGPFILSVIHYFMATFAQIFFRGLPEVALLTRAPEYREFDDYVPLDVLTDDSSLLSLFTNLFAIDVGMGTSLFFVCAFLLFAGPLLVQAGLSVAVVYICIRDGMAVAAAGLAVLYILFFTLTCVKSWSLYRSLRRGSGLSAR